MADFDAVQVSFNVGEISPDVYARVDLNGKYPYAVKKLKNFIPQAHGPATRRMGTEFIAEAKHHDKKCRLMPFEFNTEQAYVLEFGDLYIRFFADGGVLGAPYEVVTGYTEAQVQDLDSAQLNDTMYIAHPDVTQRKLVRSGHTSWAISNITFISGPADWSVGNGYPRSVTFDNDRLWWAGSPGFPQKLWGTKVGIYTDHGVSTPLVDDDALALTVNTAQANAIQWIRSSRKFAIGTTGAEYWLTSSAGDGPITALSKQRVPGSFYGCHDVKPVIVGGRILFLRRHGKTVQELAYNWEQDSFTGEEANLLARHLTRNDPIVDMAFQREPHRVLWCVLESGKLISMTYYPEHKVYGWAQHDTDGFFESVAVIPGDNEDEVWFAIRRVISGSTKRYIERMAESFKPEMWEDTTDAFFVDSGLSYDARRTVSTLAYTNPGVFTVTGHGYSDGDEITVRAQYPESYYRHENGRWVCSVDEDQNLNRERYTVFNSTANTFQVKDEDGNLVDLSSHYQADSVTVGKNITTVSGLSHLEGKELSILADGEDVSGLTVSGGSVTLSRSASVIHAGLPYESDIVTLPPTILTKTGSLQGQIMQHKNLLLQIHESLGFKYGRNQDNLVDEEFSDDSVWAGLPAPLYSGYTRELSFQGNDTRDATILIRQDQPLPLTILAILSQVEVGG